MQREEVEGKTSQGPSFQSRKKGVIDTQRTRRQCLDSGQFHLRPRLLLLIGGGGGGGGLCRALCGVGHGEQPGADLPGPVRQPADGPWARARGIHSGSRVHPTHDGLPCRVSLFNSETETTTTTWLWLWLWLSWLWLSSSSSIFHFSSALFFPFSLSVCAVAQRCHRQKGKRRRTETA